MQTGHKEGQIDAYSQKEVAFTDECVSTLYIWIAILTSLTIPWHTSVRSHKRPA